MQKAKGYIQHSDKAVVANGQFKHVMAVALDPAKNYKEGIIRCIVSREGNVEVSGYVDRSEIHLLSSDSSGHFEIENQLLIANQDEVLQKLQSEGLDFIGFEDPDIFVDEAGLTHVYFTLPFLNKTKHSALVHLGHAVGQNLSSLKMTMPVLLGDPKTYEGAKEVSIAPLNSKGVRYNLFESSKKEKDFRYSTIRVGVAETLSGPWQWGDTVFHPKDHQDMKWIAGHASPGPLFSKSFIDLGGTRLLGVINGREANRKVGNEIKYGMFSVGLFIYDYETGKIEWVSPEPFIRDTEAKTITFASQLVETAPGEGILYAHVDDSFVRAYTLNVKEIKEILPHEFK